MKGITAQWPAPNWVQTFVATREEGFSSHSPQHRLMLMNHLNLKKTFVVLNQIHGNHAVYLSHSTQDVEPADAVWTDQPGIPCMIQTGDCLPVLLSDEAGTVVGAVHAGWRGLAAGVIENTVAAMRTRTKANLLAWLGPAIGPTCFEVGQDVFDAFVNLDPEAYSAFVPQPDSQKWLANIYLLAKIRLAKIGIHSVYGGEFCTLSDQTRFYSYRLNKTNGRMASLIWLNTSILFPF